MGIGLHVASGALGRGLRPSTPSFDRSHGVVAPALCGAGLLLGMASARRRGLAVVLAFGVVRLGVPAWHGRDAAGWIDGDEALVRGLAAAALRFEAEDSSTRATDPLERFEGEWALVTHQMTALGLAQVLLAHPDWRGDYGPTLRTAALRSFLPELRGFGTHAWNGEDALQGLAGEHGHAYLAYPALAVGMARLLEPRGFPPQVVREHDALIAAWERRLLASPSALIETYPGEAYPTDVAAVAAAIAVHGRVTGADHSRVLAHWSREFRAVQRDRASGFVHQRMSIGGKPHDVPRGSGTGLAAYFAGFVDRDLARELSAALLAHERSLFGFSGIAEFDALVGQGDIDSGPVVLGVSVAATGFALAPFRAFGHRAAFIRLYRTTALFGLPARSGETLRFRTGGRIGNALLLAMLTSGPELAP
jgi:hypothetical protein